MKATKAAVVIVVIAAVLPAITQANDQECHLNKLQLAALAALKADSAMPLTAAEREAFERTGMLVLKDVLNASEVAALNAALDDWTAVLGGVAEGTTWHGYTFSEKHDTPLRHPMLLTMLLHPHVLGRVAGILGWNIWCYHAHAVYTRAISPGISVNISESQKIVPAGDHWHQDSGRVNADVEGNPRPRLSVKASYFLTDTTRPEGPQFWAVPGSHRNNTLLWGDNATGLPVGAIRVPATAGSVVIVDRRLWHAGPLGTQPYHIARRVLFYGFGPRWMRPKDPMYTAKVLEHVTDPVLRQLLGEIPSYNGLYSPTRADVPLLPWLEAQGLLDASPPAAWEDCSQSDKWVGGCA